MLARRWTATLLALGTLAAAGCSSDGGDGGAGGGGTITDLVEQVPADAIDDEATWIAVSDLDAASTLGDIERPDGDDDAVHAWLGPVSGLGDDTEVAALLPQIWQLSGAQGNDAMRERFGWTIGDITRFVEIRSRQAFLIAEATELTNDDLAEVLTATDDDDEIYMSDGDGSSWFSTIDDGRLAFAPSADEISDWRDDPETLADDEDLLALARSLDEHDAYAAIIVPEAFTGFDVHGPTVGRFDSLALGLTVEDGRAVAILAYRYGSDDEADDAVESTESVFADERLDDLFTDVEVERDGGNVVVTATVTDQPSTFWSLLARIDPILVSA